MTDPLRVMTADGVATLLADAELYASTVTVSAERLTQARTWETETGSRLAAKAGDWWVTRGARQWSVAADVFDVTYVAAGNSTYRKTAPVRAVQLSAPVTLRTLEGDATANSGDWLVQNPSGEVWPVPADVFAQTYAPVCDQGAADN